MADSKVIFCDRPGGGKKEEDQLLEDVLFHHALRHRLRSAVAREVGVAVIAGLS
jgi:hypothetical protein